MDLCAKINWNYGMIFFTLSSTITVTKRPVLYYRPYCQLCGAQNCFLTLRFVILSSDMSRNQGCPIILQSRIVKNSRIHFQRKVKGVPWKFDGVCVHRAPRIRFSNDVDHRMIRTRSSMRGNVFALNEADLWARETEWIGPTDGSILLIIEAVFRVIRFDSVTNEQNADYLCAVYYRGTRLSRLVIWSRLFGMLRAEWPLEGIHNKFRLEVGKRVGIAGGKMIEVVDLNTSLNPSCKLKQRIMAIDFKEDVLLTLPADAWVLFHILCPFWVLTHHAHFSVHEPLLRSASSISNCTFKNNCGRFNSCRA